ncbi:MAG: glucosylceramidase [Flaviaesturariibacter sp.]|nr:glucosylceramidase [Flaviaesturariibacter sp.]
MFFMIQRHVILASVFTLLVSASTSCQKKGTGGSGGSIPPPVVTTVGPSVDMWLTRADRSALLEKQGTNIVFRSVTGSGPVIDVDSTQEFQTVDGFGYTLTSGSADLIRGLNGSARNALLRELFSTDANAIGVSYLRISIGASDLSSSVYSYDDMPAGQTDPTLQHFSLGPDSAVLVPLLQEIISIQPGIRILASPWSAPAWMKDNGSSVGGSLLPQNYDAYARYFVRYLQAMAARGIRVDAVTVQNEPLHGGNNPSMVMQAAQQATFIRDHLGPALRGASLNTKIITWDHNCDRPDYPIAVMSDATARAYIDGSAFHLYGGDISALSQVHNAFPDKNVYFTEQYTASTGNFAGDLRWHVRNVVIGSMRNWSRNALEWNLANDPSFGPHTPGGCNTCQGALTIASGYTRNVSYYIIGHASKFVPAGSVRIASSNSGALYTAAFRRPDGRKVLIAVNDGSGPQDFTIGYKGLYAAATLDAGAVGTFVW